MRYNVVWHNMIAIQCKTTWRDAIWCDRILCIPRDDSSCPSSRTDTTHHTDDTRTLLQLQLQLIFHCNVLSITSSHIISHHLTSPHIVSRHLISLHLISYHFISYHSISYHFILYHLNDCSSSTLLGIIDCKEKSSNPPSRMLSLTETHNTKQRCRWYSN